MKTILKSLAAIMACLYLGGAHLAVLQLVAWTGMVVVYSGENGLANGVAETFSGEKPCPLCTAIKQAKTVDQTEHGELPPPSGKSMEKLFKDLVPCEDRTVPGWIAMAGIRIAPAEPILGDGLAGVRPPLPPPRVHG